ncbi:unnamed protein product [Candidula unifasciata]|uniref:Uncharacterized protein n=1 Tax=Candidula unifasciata TaxID=100452 RepID=A0A8S4A3I0_9EUPU|nr:unnamed protein product [Candidula unifasciata]
MGVADSFQSSSLLVKITLIVALVSNLLNWISFTTTSWATYSGPFGADSYTGLWRSCGTLGGCSQLDGSGSSRFIAIQAFGIFGFISLNVAVLLLVLYIFWGSCRGNAEVKLAAAILLFVSVVTWLIAVIVFGADFYKDVKNNYSDLDYSFGLAIVSLLLSLVCGILLVVDGNSSVGSK